MTPIAEAVFADPRRSHRRRCVLAVGKLVIAGQERCCLIRDVSSGGMMIEVSAPLVPGEIVIVEAIGLDPLLARVVWRDGSIAGLAFRTPQDVTAMGRCGAGADGLIIRSPRFRDDRIARLRMACGEGLVVVVNISVGGARLRGTHGLAAGMPGHLITGAPMPPFPGHVRWTMGDELGFRFGPALDRRVLLTLIA